MHSTNSRALSIWLRNERLRIFQRNGLHLDKDFDILRISSKFVYKSYDEIQENFTVPFLRN